MYSKFGQFIDGKWQQSQNNETYDVINPATEEVFGKASKASSEVYYKNKNTYWKNKTSRSIIASLTNSDILSGGSGLALIFRFLGCLMNSIN